MNRNDVIDVLTGVSAADRRTVGQADVDVWQAVIGDLDRDLALRAVRDHLREKPGVWLEPGHVAQRVRAVVRDQLDRETLEQREARQAQLDGRLADYVTEIAASKAVPAVRPPSPLNVRCPWCKAEPGSRCRTPGVDRTNRTYHPSRIDLVRIP